MNIFFSYLHDYKIPAGLWMLFGLIHIFLGFLYQLPVERSLLWLALCSFIGMIAVSFHFYNYYTKHKALRLLQEQAPVEIAHLPVPSDMVEADYQEILQQLNAAFSQLESTKKQNEQAILDYFTMWMHQIKIPISALHFILQEGDRETSEESEQLFRIEQYVELILQYVRLGSTSTDYHFQEVDLDAVIRDVIKKHAPFFIRKGLPVHYEEVDDHIVTDAKWLSFVLEQILSNALKYTNEGSISIYVNEKSVVIEDTGIGIRAEDIPRVGEKNFTGFTGRQHKSATGLGLHLSKQILAKLGHRMDIESEPGKGTKVSIVLNQQEITAE
ncbi:sensor histidine kinase [Virgibacillus sp. NKC19-3]|uniref:sensor histidine kinase n=1 Tax=Virgibacillus saliphilus TaxID=2831674 RepID=UPI001C9A3138|nr:sensor histidine kinase [Virgibacillus sp. NKC19-3]MBY7141982.1 sensor histidine kinase [Virgibacillus sp. NKC19-3]